MADADIAGWFPDGRRRVSQEYAQPEFGPVLEKMRRLRHYTLLQGWRRYADAPGRAMLVDWAGDTLDLVDQVDGQITTAVCTASKAAETSEVTPKIWEADVFALGRCAPASQKLDIPMASLRSLSAAPVAFLVGAVLLSACGNASGEVTSTPSTSAVAKFSTHAPSSSSATPSKSTTPTSTPTPTKTKKSAPVKVTDELTFDCGDSEGLTLAEVWKTWDGSMSASVLIDCFRTIGDDLYADDLSAYTLTEAEKKVLEHHSSDYEDYSPVERASEQMSDLGRYYDYCTDPNMGTSAFREEYGLETELETFNLVKGLCPGHPDLDELQAAANEFTAAEAQREAGTRFDDGTYRVGEDIKPGTYVSTTLKDGCYWERTNANGYINQNNFINSGLRAQVTIRSSDYSFTSERCGEWVAQ